MKKVETPCKKDLPKFLDNVNFLRRFISNLSGKIDAFTLIHQLKDRMKLNLLGGRTAGSIQEDQELFVFTTGTQGA
jgi:hypothetical protein